MPYKRSSASEGDGVYSDFPSVNLLKDSMSLVGSARATCKISRALGTEAAGIQYVNWCDICRVELDCSPGQGGTVLVFASSRRCARNCQVKDGLREAEMELN